MAPNSEEEKEFMKDKPYQEVVGSFMYLVVGTRPDLQNFIRDVSRFSTNPGIQHWKALVRGLRYLSNTKRYGILLGKSESPYVDRLLSAYSDADFANCKDTRRSVSGYITFVFGSPISWMSKKQSLVTLSTTEAEYVALSKCVQELLYLRNILEELGFQNKEPIVVYEDNQSCIKISNNPELHGRTKHISTKYFFVQERIEKHEFVIKYCPSKRMLADIFTKALPRAQFEILRKGINVISKQSALEEVFHCLMQFSS